MQSISLEEANHIACLCVNVHIVKSRTCGKSRNGHNLTTNRIHESSTRTRSNFSDGNPVPRGNSLCGRITAEGVLRLGNTNGKLAKTVLFVFFDLFVGQIRIVNSVGTVNFFANGFDLLLDALVEFIQKPEIGCVVFLAGLFYGATEICSASTTLCPVVREDSIKGTRLHGCLFDNLDFGIRVRLEFIDGNHNIDTKLFGVFNVLLQIDASLLEQFDIFFRVFFLKRLSGRDGRATSVHF
mmetsp:Transcript_10571/g.26668  ORF Transcript_10571/g.26668 Transcript_10571/m.26668 type:complete len:240 (-) Transcript_10571:276-995(-)